MCVSATYCENNCSWTFIMMIILLNFHSILSAHQLSNAPTNWTWLLKKENERLQMNHNWKVVNYNN